MLQLVLPSLLPKPVTMSAEMFKLSTNQVALHTFALNADHAATDMVSAPIRTGSRQTGVLRWGAVPMTDSDNLHFTALV